MILDTTFIIDLMNKDEKALLKLEQFKKTRETLSVTAITIFELFMGVAHSNYPEKEKEKIRKALEDIWIVSFDWFSAEKAGHLHGSLEKAGNMILPQDCMISGMVLQLKEKLLTRNTKDFNKVKGLELVTY
ncbi:MAG TPA: PIN domain-containing protein [Candidatus Nanoarchaeia archaeon]|nr:PIN domain-containing protein [Candidatus Nanoarchaeia archaeon]